MNIKSIEQSYSNYQSSNAKTISSDDFLNTIQTFYSKQNNETQENKEKNNLEKPDEENETEIRSLFKDFKSLLKKGVTLKEFKLMETYMKEILKKLDKDTLSTNEIEEVSEFLEKLETMILKMRKRISGMVVNDVDKKSEAGVSKDSLSFNFSSGETIKVENLGTKIASSLIYRIDEAIDNIEESKERLENISLTSSSKEEIELLNRLRNFRK
jgi:hypothetical protein